MNFIFKLEILQTTYKSSNITIQSSNLDREHVIVLRHQFEHVEPPQITTITLLFLCMKS